MTCRGFDYQALARTLRPELAELPDVDDAPALNDSSGSAGNGRELDAGGNARGELCGQRSADRGDGMHWGRG